MPASTTSWCCPRCGQRHNLRTSSVGMIRRCQACGHKVRVSRSLLLAQAVMKLAGSVIGLVMLGLLCNWLFCSSSLKKDAQRPADATPADAVPAQGTRSGS
jgi:uncharacterized protein (DUF983 family)